MKTLHLARSGKLLLAGILLGCNFSFAAPAQAAPKKVLVVTVTKGFRHSSIPLAEKVIAELGKENGAFTVDYARTDQDLAEKMSPAALRHYDAVIFAQTTGDLPLPDKQAFLDWIKSGKGFVGMHAAADTFPGYPAYTDMLGAHFKTHEAQVEVDALNQDPQFPACRHLPADWKVFDEIYQFKNFERSKMHGLLTMDKHPNNHTPGDYPITWCKEYGKGRVFYTSLGHREDLWDPKWPDRKNSPEVAEAYRKHILGGIKWALGLEKGNAKPQGQ